ncbi:hypothetical protein N0V84_006018 [Fusarium piperis]|uniref:RRM domain-containing protein n=1 Tax=Fusarium piperis TaxID=1435070 RepID=A0A9W8WCN6_9HYPO|nr:hypothetical protein N0V84_006018 [Fusarium piperis]
MSRHLGYSKLSQQAILQDRMLYLLRLHKKAGEIEVEELLRRHGFNDCTFYWDDTYPFFRSSTKHMGYCIVEFPDKVTRDRAMSQLQGVEFKSKRILTRLPRLNHKNDQSVPSSASSKLPTASRASAQERNDDRPVGRGTANIQGVRMSASHKSHGNN